MSSDWPLWLALFMWLITIGHWMIRASLLLTQVCNIVNIESQINWSWHLICISLKQVSLNHKHWVLLRKCKVGERENLVSHIQPVFKLFAAHWIFSDDYLLLNYPFCSVRYLLLLAQLWLCLFCLSGSLSWHDCTLMSIRAMASHAASILWKCKASCNARKPCFFCGNVYWTWQRCTVKGLCGLTIL